MSIDGTEIDGNWSIDVDAAGTAAIIGNIGLVLPDGSSLNANINASWKNLDGVCPVLDQNIDFTIGAESVAVEIGGLDLCNIDFCDTNLDISLADADGQVDITVGRRLKSLSHSNLSKASTAALDGLSR